MDINWAEIKDEMKREFADLFDRNTPAYPNVEEGIDLFQKVIYADVNSFDLGGLQRTLPQALNEAYFTKVGQLAPLRIIADSLEAYLKKICIIARLDTVEAVMSKQLMSLMKLLNLNSALSSQSRGGYPQLTDGNLASFRGAAEYLEEICDAYLTRNKVHDSPDWNKRVVLEKLNNLMVIYVLSAQKYRTQIVSLPPAISAPSIMVEKIGNSQKYLYDFISFGSTTNKIRNQIVTSCVLNYLKDNQPITLEHLKIGVNSFFDNELTLPYYQKIIQRLHGERKVVVNKETKNIELSTDELKRIDTVQKNFEENRTVFFLFLEDILKKYALERLMSEIFDKLKEFVENNYRIDFAEAYNNGIEIEKDENQAYQSFIQYLQTITSDKSQAGNLFKDLIQLSKDSDFLLRMCASKAFATLTNPDRFEQYIHQQEKMVYLDTQVILHALCLGYVQNSGYGNFYYQTAEELIDLAQKSPNIRLRVSRYYLQEVAYQLKLALLLIPFEEFGHGKISSNVFYQFYWHLRENSLLEEEDDSFGAFMYSWFKLYEEDAYDSKYWTIIYSILYELLEDPMLNIEVVTLPLYDNRGDAIDVLENVLYIENFKTRPQNSIDNDAVMMCHLCNPDEHVVEPFFLTWDKAFNRFRKDFVRKYQRNGVFSFHLFSPARFINHYSLISLKINTSAITNEFISIMDSNSIHERTQTIWDAVNKFLNIESINFKKRRKYILKVKELFESELDYTPDDTDDSEKGSRLLASFEEVVIRINDHYSSHSRYKIHDYRNLLLSENHFDVASNLIFQSLADHEKSGSLFADLDELLEKYLTGNPSNAFTSLGDVEENTPS